MADRFTIEITLDGKDNVSQHLSKVNNELGQLQRQGDSASGASDNISSGFDGMATAVGGFIAAYGAMEIGQKIGELSELGAEVKAAERVFEQLAGGPEAAANGLNQLRGATSGVVDDLTLMRGANQLLLTGLAQTTEEAAGLTEVAVKLGGAMGQDAAAAIENLNSALLNNSFPRLDTLGISAAAVRERVEELKQSGMDMSAAFSQAVLEQGRLALERLGPAADTSVTAVNKLGTAFENVKQKLGELVNTGIEKLAELAIGLNDVMSERQDGSGIIAIAEQNQANTASQEVYNQSLEETIALAQQYEQQILALDTSVSEGIGEGANDNDLTNIANYLAESPELATQFRTAGDKAGTYFRDAFNSNNQELIAEARQILEAAYQYDFSGLSDSELAAYADQIDVAFTSAAIAQSELSIETEATNAALEEEARLIEQQNALLAATDFNSLEAAGSALSKINEEFGAFNDTFEEGLFTTGGNSFFNADNLAEVQSQASALTAEYERLKGLAESSDYTLVSEIEVERAREIAANAESMASDAQKMADAWNSMSLEQLAGEGDGGQLGDFYDSVLAKIEDPELRAQAESQFALASGERTASGDVLDYGQSLVAAITDEEGIAAGQRAGEEFVTAFKDGLALGLTGEALQDYVEEQVGFALDTSGGGEQITVQQGEGYQALANRTGYSQEELMAATGGRMLQAGEVITVGDGTTLIAVNGSPEELTAAATANIYGGAEGAISASTPYSPQGDYGYYDPLTGQVNYVNDPTAQQQAQAAAQADLFSPEQTEAVSQVSEDMLSIETSMTNIAATDTSDSLTPMLETMMAASTEAGGLEKELNAMASRQYRMSVSLGVYLDYSSIPELANNPAFAELFATVVRNNPSIVDVGGN